MTEAVVVDARPASSLDLPAVVVLAAQARLPLRDVRGGDVLLALDATQHDLDDAITRMAGADDAIVVVGQLDQVIVGYLLARLDDLPDGRRHAVVVELYVEPPARQVGVGDALLTHALDWAVDRGCVGIDATALPGDRATKNFFESHGLVARAILAHRSLP